MTNINEHWSWNMMTTKTVIGMTTKMVIGLGGYAFAGKDAAADVLVKLGWKKTYMSKKLRESLLALDPYIPEHDKRYSELDTVLGYEDAKKIPEVRSLLQKLGTEVGRNLYGEDFWVDLMHREVAGYLAEGHSVAVTGIRYLNELNAIWNLGGINIWVERPGFEAVNGHSSENSLGRQYFDGVLLNDGTLEDLARATDRLRWNVISGVYN